jgi:hypothetical protein
MPSDVPLTRAQKWDLVRISAAAVASTVFFTFPLFLVRPDQRADRTQGGAAERPAMAVPSVSQPSAQTASPTIPPVASASVDRNAISVVTSTEFATATTPGLQKNTNARSRATKPAQIRARANTPAPAATPSLSRRLARFIAGSGKYNVKPFPTLNTSGS